MITVERAQAAMATAEKMLTPEGDTVTITAVDPDAGLAEITGSMYDMRHWMPLTSLTVKESQ